MTVKVQGFLPTDIKILQYTEKFINDAELTLRLLNLHCQNDELKEIADKSAALQKEIRDLGMAIIEEGKKKEDQLN